MIRLSREKNNQDFRWWLSDDPYEDVIAAANYIVTRDTDRREDLLRAIRMYGNTEYGSFEGYDLFRTGTTERMTMNIVKSGVDTIVSKIAKNHPKPTFITSGGNYQLRRRAQLLEKFVETKFYTKGIYKLGSKFVQDSALMGTGCLKIFKSDGDIAVERTFIGELVIDQIEAIYGDPRQIFQRKFITRDVLIGLYPEHKSLLMSTSQASAIYGAIGRDSSADQVEVWEAWHLPSSKESDDGRHVICVENVTLLNECYEKDYFPFVFLRWSDRIRGFWGIGIAEELLGIQIELNRLLQKVQKIFHLMAVPRVFVEAGSKVNKAYMNNQIGAVVPYVGQKPEIQAAATVNPEIFAYIDRLWTRGFEIIGVSQLSSGGTKPSGLDSAASMREYNDIQSERFANFGCAYEEAFMEIARQIVDLGRELAEDNPDYGGMAQKDRYTIATVKWKDIDLERDSYVLKVFPTSSLPSTPAGRLAMVQDLMNAQLIDAETAKRLLDFPDLESEMALDRAAMDDIDRIIEMMLDDGDYVAPEPFQDHMLALKRVQSAYLKARCDNVPDSRLSLLREYMAATYIQLQQAQMAVQGPQGAADSSGQPPMAPTGQEGQ